MAEQQERGVVTVERDGIAVEVDMAYMRSWDGIVRAADMQSERLSDAQRLVAMVDYYQGACPNINDVNAALRKRDPATDANAVMQFVADALKDATPKN